MCLLLHSVKSVVIFIEYLFKCAQFSSRASGAHHALSLLIVVHILSINALEAKLLAIVAGLVGVIQTILDLASKRSYIVIHSNEFVYNVIFLLLQRDIQFGFVCC